MKHFSFPSIEQFRGTVKHIRDNCEYHGVPLPTIKFKGTVKLHGTNAGVVKSLVTSEIWAQSREHVITPLNDNAGFAQFTNANRIQFENLFKAAQDLCGSLEGISSTTALYPFTNPSHIAIFGEWCGKGIMKGVAINQLDKRFVIFGIRVITDNEDPTQVKMGWFTPEMITNVYATVEPTLNAPIFNIYDFPTFSIDIDFARPELAQNELVRITSEVEAECPVGKAFIADAVNGCEVSMENGKLISSKPLHSIIEVEVKKLLLTLQDKKLVLSV